MEDIIALIDELLKEHQQILQNIKTLEQATDDLGAALKLEEVKQTLMPGRLEQQQQDLPKLEEILAALELRLQGHFNREETGLLTAFERHGNRMLASALNTLLLEHQPLRQRLNNLKVEIAELESAGLSQEVWDGKVWGLRAYITHTRKLLEEHAHSEYSLLERAREEIAGG